LLSIGPEKTETVERGKYFQLISGQIVAAKANGISIIKKRKYINLFHEIGI